MPIVSTRADIEASFAEAEADLARVVSILAQATVDPVKAEPDLPKAFFALAKAKAEVAKAEADLANARAACVNARNALARLNFEEGKPKTYRSEFRHATHGAYSGPGHVNRRKSSEDRRRRAAASRAHAAGHMGEEERRKSNDDRRFARAGLGELDGAQPIPEPGDRTDAPLKPAIVQPGPGAAASVSDPNAAPPSTQSREHSVRAVEKPAANQPTSRLFSGRFPVREGSAGNTLALSSLTRQTVQLSSLILAYLLYYFIDVKLQILMLPSVVALV
jgi:hypothetical protein